MDEHEALKKRFYDGQRWLLADLLIEKFGAAPHIAYPVLMRWPEERIMELAHAMFRARTLEDLGWAKMRGDPNPTEPSKTENLTPAVQS